MWRIGIARALGAVAVLLLGGCVGTGGEAPGSATPSATASVGNGALIVEWADGSGAQRYPIGADGAVGAPAELSWESGPEAQATQLWDAVGPWALTATYELPLNDVSANTALQVRDVVTGEVLHRLDVTNWCLTREAHFPCVLLDESRIARTTPLYEYEDGTVIISAMDTGRTLAEYGPFPLLADMHATTSPDALILVGTDLANTHQTVHGPVPGILLTRLDLNTGDTALIGSLPTSQPWLCTIGTDSVLAVDGTTLQALGPAVVAPVEVPELADDGPGAVGCTPDGRYLYVRTDWTDDPDPGLVIDAINLEDGTRTPGVLTLKSRDAAVRVTR